MKGLKTQAKSQHLVSCIWVHNNILVIILQLCLPGQYITLCNIATFCGRVFYVCRLRGSSTAHRRRLRPQPRLSHGAGSRRISPPPPCAISETTTTAAARAAPAVRPEGSGAEPRRFAAPAPPAVEPRNRQAITSSPASEYGNFCLSSTTAVIYSSNAEATAPRTGPSTYHLRRDLFFPFRSTLVCIKNSPRRGCFVHPIASGGI